MLDFSGLLETKRFSEIANVGINNDTLTDVGFLEKEIRKWLVSSDRKKMIEADGYYDYEQAIRNKKRLIIGDGGKLVEDAKLPNNKLMDNMYSNMVDQKVNYLLSKPLTFKCDNEAYADILNDVFNRKFHKLLKNVGKDSYNGGIGWIYPYYDEAGEFKFRRFRPYEILPFWKDDDHTELDCAVRYWEQKGYEGDVEKVFKFVEVYDTKGIHRFTWENGGLKPDYQTYYFEMPDLEGDTIPYNWDRVPLIPFKANQGEIPLLKRCKSLQDAINELLSNFQDSMQENCSGNSILVLKNYDGTNLGEFRQNLSQYKAVKVRTVDGADGGIDALNIEVNATNYQVLLAELRKAVILNCRGYDVNELKSSGSPNEMTIKSVYSNIDLDANELETEYQSSFEELLYFVNVHLEQRGLGNYFNEVVDVIFDRDMMVNESQVMDDVVKSMAVLSRKTCVAQHPYVTDVEAEMLEIEKERQQMIDDFGNSMVDKADEETE